MLKTLAVNEDRTLKRAFFASYPDDHYDAGAFDRKEFLALCGGLLQEHTEKRP